MKKYSPILLIVTLLATVLVHPALADSPVTSLEVTKTAEGHWSRYLDWTLDKTADPETADIFVNDEQDIRYDVTVSQVGYTDVYRVSGAITIQNDPDAVTINSNLSKDEEDKTAFIAYVDDAIEARVNGLWIEVSRTRLRGPFTIPTDGTEIVEYDLEFTPPVSATAFRNVARVGLENHAPPPGEFREFLYKTRFSLPSAPLLYNECVDVNDSYAGFLGTVCGEDASEIFTYYRTVGYDTPGTYYVENTATADGQEASATVVINVWDLDVSKDANTSYTRTYNWSIDKAVDQPELALSLGQQHMVSYTVATDATYTDSAWAVSGNIWVVNPAPIPATINGVSDLVSPDIAVNVDCGVAFPYVLVAGDTLVCSYSAALPDAAARTNTATTTLQNHFFDYMGNASPIGTTDFSGQADVVFGDPTTLVDECIDVNDTHVGFLGAVCYPNVPATFTYNWWIGPYDLCGTYNVDDTATFVTNDTGTTGSDSQTVIVDVPCAGGCTLTPGYWKTHSEYGPAPYDETWALLSNGADTPFFDTGLSWYETMWTPPQGGNAYYILAHAYAAAVLNELNGADTSVIAVELAHAAYLLDQYDGDPMPMDYLLGQGADPIRQDFIDTAYVLDQYNNGIIGPGHCSE